MNKKLLTILKKCGVPNHLRGYEYIGEAVQLVYEDREYLHRVTKALYPTVARKFHTTSSRVERAIRHAAETSFDNMSPDAINELFGNTISYYKGKPTNSQFIATIVEIYAEELDNGH